MLEIILCPGGSPWTDQGMRCPLRSGHGTGRSFPRREGPGVPVGPGHRSRSGPERSPHPS